MKKEFYTSMGKAARPGDIIQHSAYGSCKVLNIKPELSITVENTQTHRQEVVYLEGWYATDWDMLVIW